MCDAGRECVVSHDDDNDEGRRHRAAVCACVSDCGRGEVDPRRMVCSGDNETFPSECHLHRARCLCQEGSSECPDDGEGSADRLRHAHVEYYGKY